MQRILAGKHSSWTSYYWWSLGWVANIYLLNNYVESNSIPFVFKDQGLKSLSLLTGFSLQICFVWQTQCFQGDLNLNTFKQDIVTSDYKPYQSLTNMIVPNSSERSSSECGCNPFHIEKCFIRTLSNLFGSNTYILDIVRYSF